jgi:hypothetical protein
MYTVVYDTVYDRLRQYTESVTIDLGVVVMNNWERIIFRELPIRTSRTIHINTFNSHTNFIYQINLFITHLQNIIYNEGK